MIKIANYKENPDQKHLILYSTGCPQCRVLKSKLEKSNIEFEVSDDMNFLLKNKIRTVPILKVNDELLNFKQAIDYIENLGG